MARKLSKIAPDWWDYTTLDSAILKDAAKLTPKDMVRLSREGFKVVFYDTLEDFYLAEALEYIEAWRQATPDNPVGICGPIGPTGPCIPGVPSKLTPHDEYVPEPVNAVISAVKVPVTGS